MTFNEQVRRAWGPRWSSETESRRICIGHVGGDYRARHDRHLRRHPCGLDSLAARQAYEASADRRQRRRRQRQQGDPRRGADGAFTIPTPPCIRSPSSIRSSATAESASAAATGSINWRRILHSARRSTMCLSIRTNCEGHSQCLHPCLYADEERDSAADPHRRKVSVYVRSQDGRALSVRTRDGYFEKTSEDRR